MCRLHCFDVFEGRAGDRQSYMPSLGYSRRIATITAELGGVDEDDAAAYQCCLVSHREEKSAFSHDAYTIALENTSYLLAALTTEKFSKPRNNIGKIE